jgi:hypothetical protein
MEPEGSLPFSQEPSTGPYPEPETKLQILITFVYPQKGSKPQADLSFWREP